MYYTPLVSILTPIYKGERFIASAIESVLNQTYPHFELILINDGSPDNSATFIKPYLIDPRVMYIEQANAGVAAARNTGLLHATGELIGFLDQDDLWMPNKLQQQVDYLISHPQIGLVHSYQSYIDETGKYIDYNEDWIEPITGDCFRTLFIRNRIAILTVLIRREVIKQVGLFKENLNRVDDYELWMRIAMKYPFGFLDQTLALYRVHEKNASHDRLKMRLLALEANQSILAEFPQARQKIDSHTIKDVFFSHHYAIGREYLWPRLNHRIAKKYFFKAILYKPSSIYTYGFLMRTMLTPAQWSKIQWYLGKFKKFMRLSIQ